MSDEAFLSRFLPRYPEWQQRPGRADALAIFELARELQLATGIELSRDYDRILREHHVGHAILVQTERIPEQENPSGVTWPLTMLLEDMSPADFVVWCPFESGGSDLLPRAARARWESWFAVGIILFKGRPA